MLKLTWNLWQPCSICVPTELHQEFQGQTHRQTRVLSQSNDKPIPLWWTRLQLWLPSAPHSPQRTPGSHLTLQNAHIQPHTSINALQTFTVCLTIKLCQVQPTISQGAGWRLYSFSHFGPVLLINFRTQNSEVHLCGWGNKLLLLKAMWSNSSHHTVWLQRVLCSCTLKRSCFVRI